jgi:hypothetical protein
MANRWVEFVRKWAKDNNMNYMCAMTTKECKEAYLKEYPKPEKKAKPGARGFTLDTDGAISWNIGQSLVDMANLGNDAWSGSLDNIKALAKKNKVSISKYIDKTEGWFGESNTIEKILDGFDDSKNPKVYDFFEDIFKLLEEYKQKAEQKSMKEQDVPAPAKRKAGRPKKVVVGDVAPKKRVGRPKKVVVGDVAPKKAVGRPKIKAKEVVTDQQEELVKLIVEGARKAGLPEDFAERIVLRKVKS